MIKIDYEGAWKELKNKLGRIEKIGFQKHYNYSNFLIMIEKLEQKHTHDYIDIKRRGNKEIADYCMKKYSDLYLKHINLKNRLKKLIKEKL